MRGITSRRSLLWAVALDLALGEPRCLHPVVGMGNTLRRIRGAAAGRGPVGARVAGGAGVLAGTLVWGALGVGLTRIARTLPPPWREVAGGAVLKPTFALRALLEAGGRVREALASGNLEGARGELGRSLVSRPTAALKPHEVVGATLSSLAENLTDSVVAPLMWSAAAGAAGGWAYRFVNTADAVLGYRTPELLHVGGPAALADDAANALPARLATLLLVASAQAVGGDGGRAWKVACRDNRRTPSPNGGWTMAAAAGALGVRLEKRGHYVLHPEGRRPGVADLDRGLRMVGTAAAGAVALTALLLPPGDR